MADAHDIQSWLNGDRLRSQKIKEQYPLIGLIVGLIFLYILTGYQSIKQQHRLTDTKKEIPLHDGKRAVNERYAAESGVRGPAAERQFAAGE